MVEDAGQFGVALGVPLEGCGIVVVADRQTGQDCVGCCCQADVQQVVGSESGCVAAQFVQGFDDGGNDEHVGAGAAEVPGDCLQVVQCQCGLERIVSGCRP